MQPDSKKILNEGITIQPDPHEINTKPIYKVLDTDVMVIKRDTKIALAGVITTDFKELLKLSGLDRFLLYIEDEDLEAITMIALEDAPKNFWVSPASLYHHPPDERGIGGLVIHTNRVCDMALDLLDIYNIPQGSKLFQWTLIACIFHDICKGSTGEGDGSERFLWSESGRLNMDHPEIGATYLEERGFPDEIVSGVRWHHGKWGDPPGDVYEYNDVELFTHLADKLISVNDLHRTRRWIPEKYLERLIP